jgi:hypothetical protein
MAKSSKPTARGPARAAQRKWNTLCAPVPSFGAGALAAHVASRRARRANFAGHGEAIDRGYRFYSYGDAMLLM